MSKIQNATVIEIELILPQSWINYHFGIQSVFLTFIHRDTKRRRKILFLSSFGIPRSNYKSILLTNLYKSCIKHSFSLFLFHMLMYDHTILYSKLFSDISFYGFSCRAIFMVRLVWEFLLTDFVWGFHSLFSSNILV